MPSPKGPAYYADGSGERVKPQVETLALLSFGHKEGALLEPRPFSLYFSQGIVWDKQHPVLTRKDFMGCFEIAYYGWKDGSPLHNWTLPIDTWLDPQDLATLAVTMRDLPSLNAGEEGS